MGSTPICDLHTGGVDYSTRVFFYLFIFFNRITGQDLSEELKTDGFLFSVTSQDNVTHFKAHALYYMKLGSKMLGPRIRCC